MRITVYSAVDGNYPPHPEVQTYTGYKQFNDPNRNAKIYKILPHLFLPEHDWSIWIDSTITLLKPPESLVRLVKGEVGVFHHWERNCLYDEAVACQTLDDPNIINLQMERYRSKGFPAHAGLAMCGIIIRKNTDKVNRLNEQWWAEICRGSRRDQLSFPYVFKDVVHYLPKANHAIGNQYFKRI